MTNLIKHPMRKRWNKGCFVKSIIKSYSIMRKKIKSGPTQIVLIVGHCVGGGGGAPGRRLGGQHRLGGRAHPGPSQPHTPHLAQCFLPIGIFRGYTTIKYPEYRCVVLFTRCCCSAHGVNPPA